MPAIPFKTETRSFAKKGDASAFYEGILNRYRPGDVVIEEDADELFALLKLHTDATAKIGVGIVRFEVMTNIGGTQSFKIVRLDNSWDDFSYKHCITPKKD